MKNLQKILVLVLSLMSGFLVATEADVCAQVAESEVVCPEHVCIECRCPSQDSSLLVPECGIEEYVRVAEKPQSTFTAVLPDNRVVVFDSLLLDVPLEVASEIADITIKVYPELMAVLGLSHTDLTLFALNAGVLLKHRMIQKFQKKSLLAVEKDFYSMVLSAQDKEAIEEARLAVATFGSTLNVDDKAFDSLPQNGPLFKTLIIEFARFIKDISSDNDDQALLAGDRYAKKIKEIGASYSEGERQCLALLSHSIVQECLTSKLLAAFIEKQSTSIEAYSLFAKKMVMFVESQVPSGECEAICVPGKKEVYTDLATVSDDSFVFDHGYKMSFVRDDKGKATLLIVGSDVFVKPLQLIVPVEEEVVVKPGDGRLYKMAVTKAEQVVVFNA